MHRRGPSLLVALFLVFALVAAACGDSDDGDDAEPSPTTAAADEGSDGEGDDGSDADGGDATDESEAPATTAAADGGAGGGSVDELVIAISGDESTLNPYTYVTGYPGWNLLGLLNDTLLVLDAANEPAPLLATDWTVSEDGLQWSLTLRDDVTWHDGEPFDADDVAFTVEYVTANPQSRWTPAVAPVASVDVVSPTEVVFNLSEPTPTFGIRPLADMPILAEHVWTDIADPNASGVEQAIGTGPYRLVDYSPDQAYTLEANPDYAMGTPVVETLVLAVIPEPATAFAALRAGEVDLVSSILEPQLVDEFSGSDDIDVLTGPGFASTLLNLNNERAPFDRVEVRQAISLAIDSQELIDTVLLGTGTPPNPGFLHPEGPVTQGAVADVHDPDAAAALLDGIGATAGDDGIRVLDGEPMVFELLVYADNPGRIRSAEIISEQLDAVGIVAEVTPLEAETVDEQVWPGFDVNNGRDYDMAMWGWSPPIQLDAGRLASLFSSDLSVGTLNVTGFADPAVDALLDEISAAATEADREEPIAELEALLAEVRPFVMLYYQDGAYAFRTGTYDGWVYQNGQGPLGKLSLVDGL